MPGLFQPAVSSNEESDDVPNLIPREESSDEKKENNIANVARKTKVPKEKTRPRNTKGKWTNYLALLDTGSTRSLISKELVEKYNMPLVKDNGYGKQTPERSGRSRKQ